MHNEYGNAGSYALVMISLFFGWISKLGMDQIAWMISLVSGVFAIISFGLRIEADWVLRRKIKKQKQDERVVEKPE